MKFKQGDTVVIRGLDRTSYRYRENTDRIKSWGDKPVIVLCGYRIHEEYRVGISPYDWLTLPESSLELATAKVHPQGTYTSTLI